jgi:imidazoleglycerol-phosphate dehydratase
MRSSQITRNTSETKVSVSLDVDGTGLSDINTGIGFFDHMLVLFAKHSKMDLTVKCNGDLDVDGHHTVEDVGIVIGQAIKEALGDKRGVIRYGSARIPMDEALVIFDIDISGRPYLQFNAVLNSPKVGDFETSLTEEFFRAIVHNSLITAHVNCEYGKNDHHIIEGMFKSFARALRQAVRIDPCFSQEIPSTKGLL